MSKQQMKLSFACDIDTQADKTDPRQNWSSLFRVILRSSRIKFAHFTELKCLPLQQSQAGGASTPTGRGNKLGPRTCVD